MESRICGLDQWFGRAGQGFEGFGRWRVAMWSAPLEALRLVAPSRMVIDVSPRHSTEWLDGYCRWRIYILLQLLENGYRVANVVRLQRATVAHRLPYCRRLSKWLL